MVLERRNIPAHPVEHAARKAENIGQGEGVIELSSQGQRFLAQLQSLIGIAKAPQAAGIVRYRACPCIRSTEVQDGAVMHLGFIEGERLCEVGAGRRIFSESEEDNPQIPVSERHKHRVLGALSLAQRLFSELTRPLMLSPHIVRYRQLAQYVSELRRLSCLLDQFARPG